jgi:hypothetical protein
MKKNLEKFIKNLRKTEQRRKLKPKEKMQKYRDNKWRKADIKKQGLHLDIFNKEIGRETATKIIKYEENLKKLNMETIVI